MRNDYGGVAYAEDGRYEADLMREEVAYRAEGNFSRETAVESRTIPLKRQRTHVHSLNGKQVDRALGEVSLAASKAMARP